MSKFIVTIYPIYCAELEVEAATPAEATRLARARFDEDRDVAVFVRAFDRAEEVTIAGAGGVRHWLGREGEWRCHHDARGWYLVEPEEDEPASGRGLGRDGRAHYPTEEAAWAALATAPSVAGSAAP